MLYTYVLVDGSWSCRRYIFQNHSEKYLLQEIPQPCHSDLGVHFFISRLKLAIILLVSVYPMVL